MRYLMKQKLFNFLGQDFVIKDEAGRETFLVTSEGFGLRSKFSFQDPAGKELAFIEQEGFWGSTYDIRKGDAVWAVVHKEFSFFKSSFTIEVVGQEGLVVEGDFSGHEYIFTCAEKPIAQVSKQWFTWSDTYGVDVDQQGDDILILASTVVIDICCHEKDD